MIFTKQIRSISYYKVHSWYSGLIKPRQQKPPYYHVVQVGDPRLRNKAEQIPLDQIKTPEIQKLIKQMKCVLEKYECVGLSAPQIGVNSRMFLMEFNENHKKHYSEKEFKLKEMLLVPFTV